MNSRALAIAFFPLLWTGEAPDFLISIPIQFMASRNYV